MALQVSSGGNNATVKVVSSAPTLSRTGQIYWKGADGNYYLKGAGGNGAGVTNLGNAQQAKPWDLTLNGAQEIADPVASDGGGDTSTPAPAGGGGGGAAVKKVDKSNDINLNLAGLGAVDQQTSSGIAAIDKVLATLKGQYADEAAANEKSYTDNTNTNVGNLQKNKQSAMVNGAQGRRGLFSTLSSLGALNGSGIDLANNAVKRGVEVDLSGATDNYATNQGGLDLSIGKFRREDKNRNENADLTAGNAKTNVQNDAARSKQNFYKNLANDYDEMGDSGNSAKYSGMAASLYPAVAASNVPNANLGYSSAAFDAPTLESYLAGQGGTQVTATPTQPGAGAAGLPGLTVGGQAKKKLSTQLV